MILLGLDLQRMTALRGGNTRRHALINLNFDPHEENIYSLQTQI